MFFGAQFKGEKMADNVIDNAIEFLNKLRGGGIVTIKFQKQDGSIRVMRCTLDFDEIPIQDRPKDVNLPKILHLLNSKKIVHVYDVEKKGWRSVPFDRSEWIETPDKKRYSIKR